MIAQLREKRSKETEEEKEEEKEEKNEIYNKEWSERNRLHIYETFKL